MNNTLLTIAIPSLPSRYRKNFEGLYLKIQNQIKDRKDIQILSLLDNRTMSIGEKRTKLFSVSSGIYTCIIDDDDDVSDDFVSSIIEKIDLNNLVDVICYNQLASVNGKKWIIKTSLSHNKVHPFDQLQTDIQGNPIPCFRPPWHWCAWRTDLARTVGFGDSNCHEDAIFVREISKIAKTEIRIDKILCYYNESQTPFNSSLDINSIKQVKI